MIIHAIRLANFGLYAGEQVIKPASGRYGKGVVTLIGGLNGRGKTSLLEAVLLALYGNRSPVVREKNTAYPGYLESLIHRGVPKTEGASVELEIELPIEGDPTVLRIRRSWKGKGRIVDKLEIWRGGIQDVHLATNWDTYVEELIPSGISGLFFFDGEKIATLAEEEETSETLRESIRSLLGLDLVDRLVADLSVVIRRNQVKIGRVEGVEVVERLERDLEQQTIDLQKLKQEQADLANRIERAQEELHRKEQEYLQRGGSFARNREELEREQKVLMEKLARLRATTTIVAGGAMPLMLVLPLLQQIQEGVAADERVHQAKTLLPVLIERDERVVRELAAHGIDGATVALLEDLLRSDRAALNVAAEQERLFALSPVAQGQLADLLRGGQVQLTSQAESLLQEQEEAEEKLGLVNQHLRFRVDEKGVRGSLQELAELARKLADLQHQRDRLQREIESASFALQQLEQRKMAALTKVLEKVDAVHDARRAIEIALRSQEKMRVFGREVTARKMGVLERSVTQAFKELTHKATLATEVRIDPESLKITLHHTDGAEIPKNRLSSGEKQMLAVSILWGLARASGRDLPVIIDSPMGRLDSSHRMNFVAHYLPNASHQVMVLSTDTEIVGPYYDLLRESIGREYLLRYDEGQRRTEVTDGYFSREGGIPA